MTETTKDNLKEYLAPYRDEEIKKIRDEKIQLVTATEFVGLHQEKLAAEREVEKLKADSEALKKALIEIRANIEEHNQIYDLSVDTALLLEGIDGIAFDALSVIGGGDEL